MKSYSRKQAGVIFANWKQGNLHATDTTIKHMYSYADGWSMHWQPQDLDMIQCIRAAVDCIFAGNIDGAQAQLDRFEDVYDLHYTDC